MAPLTRILVSCVGPVSNKKFFPHLLLIRSSFKNLWPCVTLYLCLFDLLKPLLIPCGLTFPFLFLSQLFSSVLFENGFCIDFKYFKKKLKTAGETEAQRVVSCAWLKAIP